MMERQFTRHFARCVSIDAPPGDVFSYLNRHARLATHMTQASWMMGGGRMDISVDEGGGEKLGSHIRMSGKAFGISLFLDEVVTRYEPPVAKVWGTVNTLRLLVIGHYRMGFELVPQNAGSKLCVFIDYNLPESLGGRVLGFLLGRVYAKWCVNSMLRDAVEHFSFSGKARMPTHVAS